MLKDADTEQKNKLALATGDHARALFAGKHCLCSAAVLRALNQHLDGGLTQDQANGLASGFGHAMGGSGCLCGALSGAVLGLGLFLSELGDRTVRKEAANLHQIFRQANGSTCCRVLQKKVEREQGGKRARFEQCTELSAQAAEAAARIILQRRPELARTPAPADQPAPRNGPLARLGHFSRSLGKTFGSKRRRSSFTDPQQ